MHYLNKCRAEFEKNGFNTKYLFEFRNVNESTWHIKNAPYNVAYLEPLPVKIVL